MTNIIRSLIFILCLVSLVSCQETNSNSQDELLFGQPDITEPKLDDNGNVITPTAYELAQGTLTSKCVSCHTGYHGSWGAYTTEQDWITSGTVIPGDADGSAVIDRLSTWGMGNSGGTTMPLGLPAISAEEYAYINDWINNI